MVWLVWLVTSLVSVCSGIFMSRRYLNANLMQRGSSSFYYAVAALNYCLLAFGLMTMAWYEWALGTQTESLLFWIEGIFCGLNVCIATSALRKASHLQDLHVADKKWCSSR